MIKLIMCLKIEELQFLIHLNSPYFRPDVLERPVVLVVADLAAPGHEHEAAQPSRETSNRFKRIR